MSGLLDSESSDGLEVWRAKVLQAQAQSDESELGRLFVELVDNLGTERASHVWLEAMSAWDANAITG
jgi:uncharacterized protein YdaL